MSLKKFEARSDFTSGMKPVSQKRKLRQAIESLSKTTHFFRILDQDGDGCLNLIEFSKGMSLFLRGTFEETAKFCFDVYDINGDGFISKEEVSQLLKKAIIRNRSDDDPDETFKELVELAIKKLDKDSDHKVSRSDFEKATSEEKLLMQCLGKCLPDRGIAHKFEKALFHSR